MKIALIAHDNKKADLQEWVHFNYGTLSQHELVSTQHTGEWCERMFGVSMRIKKVRSGPLGGDMQIGSMIVNGEIDMVIFFWDPLSAHPHDPDVKALLRICTVHNILTACNRITADYIISSILFNPDIHALHEGQKDVEMK